MTLAHSVGLRPAGPSRSQNGQAGVDVSGLPLANTEQGLSLSHRPWSSCQLFVALETHQRELAALTEGGPTLLRETSHRRVDGS